MPRSPRRLISALVALGAAAACLLLTAGPSAQAAPAAGVPATASVPSGVLTGAVPAGAGAALTAVTAPRAASLTPAATGSPCSSTPFRSVPSKHHWFRIPAVVRTSSGTLVAFAERRDTLSTTDMGDFDVVTARSTDHGCHWSAYRVIGNDGANRVSNPVPLVDASTGDLLLFSVVTPRPNSGGHGKGLYLQTSTDDGKTFSALLSHPVLPRGYYHGGLTGPGHAIQLTVTHPGRLIVPLGYRTAAGRYGAYGIYSDDHGATWQTGYDQLDSTGRLNLIEGTIAELPSGSLFISYRDKKDAAKAGTARQYAISINGGLSLSELFRPLALPIVSVQGSALDPAGAHNDELLFSAPADRTPSLRRDMSIFVSRTAGATLSGKYQVELQDTPGSYSDLVQVGADTIGVLYETGTTTWKERIAFESVPIPALTHPDLVTSTLSSQRSAHPTAASARAKVQAIVRVPGIGSPPGRVWLTVAGKGTPRTAAVDLTYSNRGVRWITLPKLAKGTYHLTLTYSGTGRISGRTTSAGTLHVVKG